MSVADVLVKTWARQRWVRWGVRERVVIWHCHPDKVKSKPFDLDFFGFKYPGDLNSYIDWNAYFYGAYERENLRLYRDILRARKGSVFLDVGANVGHHSLYLMQYCAEIHAFEPNPLVLKKIHQKVAVNDLKNLHVHGVGLGAEDADLQYYAPKGANQGTGSFVDGYSENNCSAGLLRVVQADAYIGKLNIKRIDLIKIDVEGFEKNALMGLKGTLDLYRPAVILEFSAATKKTFDNVEEFMSMFPAGYVVRSIQSNRPWAGFFNRPSYVLNQFDFDVPGVDLLIAPSDWRVCSD